MIPIMPHDLSAASLEDFVVLSANTKDGQSTDHVNLSCQNRFRKESTRTSTMRTQP
jgi:hypothetical protein